MGNLKGEGWVARLVAEAAKKEGLAREKFLMPLVVKCLSAPSTSMAPGQPVAQLGSIEGWTGQNMQKGAAADLLNILTDIKNDF